MPKMSPEKDGRFLMLYYALPSRHIADGYYSIRKFLTLNMSYDNNSCIEQVLKIYYKP